MHRPLRPTPIKPPLPGLWLALLLLALLLPDATPAQARGVQDDQRNGYTIIARIPHDPAAFTQGFLFHDGVFYESTGLYGRSSLRRLDPDTGEVLQRRDLPVNLFGEGLALVGERLIQLTWKAGRALVWDRDSFELLNEFHYATEGWGLTFDGERLIMTDGSANLYFRDPDSFRLLGTRQVTENGRPVARLNELEYIHGEIWANIWMTDDIVRIDPDSGEVLARLDFSDLLSPADRHGNEDVLNGIAYDTEGERLFITGKRYGYIYHIELD